MPDTAYLTKNEIKKGAEISEGDIVIISDDNIRRKALVKKAIALNEHYANLYGSEKNWDL